MAFSYQHEYHAGNHADVLKHSLLLLLLSSLCKKEKPFTVIDSHAGSGRYNLAGEMAQKTQEALYGIKKLESALRTVSPLPQGISLLKNAQSPYLAQQLYAGSPELERLFLRTGDALHLIEKHPRAVKALQENMTLPLITGQENQMAHIKPIIHPDDSYKTLVALTPPLIKRGLIFIDPSYEEESDYKTVSATVNTVHKKWNTAIIALWYPLIARRKNETAKMLYDIEYAVKTCNGGKTEIAKTELELYNPSHLPNFLKEENGSHLYGSGVFVINPPWKYEDSANEVATFLSRALH